MKYLFEKPVFSKLNTIGSAELTNSRFFSADYDIGIGIKIEQNVNKCKFFDETPSIQYSQSITSGYFIWPFNLK